jgi:beta-lactamase regulating signal transducer with metallopeptidase domain
MIWEWPATTAWLGRSALGGGVLLLLVWGLTFIVRQPVRRQRLAECGVLASLLVAGLSLGPTWVVVPLPWWSQSTPALEIKDRNASEEGDESSWNTTGSENLQGEIQAAGLETWPATEETVAGSQMTDHPSAGTSDGAWIGLATVWVIPLYLGGVLLLLGRWLLGHWALRRFLRTAVAAPEPVVQLFTAMAGADLRRPRLLMSHYLSVPVSCGLMRPTVVLPARLCGLAHLPTLRWVFAHELTHVQRRDACSCLLLGLVGAVYFYCPWFWWLRRQVRLCQEYVADAAAVRLAQVEDYAQFLLGLATSRAGPVTAIGVFGNTSDLYRRVTMLLEGPVRVEKQCPRFWSLGIAAGLATAAVLISGLGSKAGMAESASPDRLSGAAVSDQEPGKKAEPNPNKQKNPFQEEYQRRLEEVQKALEKLDLNKLMQDGGFAEHRKALQKSLQEMEKVLNDLPVQEAVER